MPCVWVAYCGALKSRCRVAQGGRFEESRGRGERAGSAEHAWSAAKAKRRASDAFALTVTSNPKRSAVTQRPVAVSPVTACHVLLLRGVKRSGHRVRASGLESHRQEPARWRSLRRRILSAETARN